MLLKFIEVYLCGLMAATSVSLPQMFEEKIFSF